MKRGAHRRPIKSCCVDSMMYPRLDGVKDADTEQLSDWCKRHALQVRLESNRRKEEEHELGSML